MTEIMLGEIKIFAGNFEPPGWLFCDGRLLAIREHTALFEILGNTYGGDGRTTFGLPDLRGRAPMGQGAGPGLTNRNLGEEIGNDGVSSGLDVNTTPVSVLSFIIAISGKNPRDEVRILRGISE